MNRKIFLPIAVTLLCGLYATNSFSQNAIANYPLNGDAIDHSGNGYNGTVIGAITTTDRFGVSSRAYSFDGIDDGIDLSGTTSFSPIANEFTISAWIRPDAFTASEKTIVSNLQFGSPTEGFQFVLTDNATGEAKFLKGEVFNNSWTFGGTVVANTWQHVAMTFTTSGFLKLFLNGVKTVEIATNTATVGNTSNLVGIGNSTDSPPFDGAIDDVRIFDVELSEADVQLLYELENLGPPVISSFSPPAGPVGTVVTLSGNNFSTTLSENHVYFGATKATVNSATNTSMDVVVPDGATYQPITVTVDGLTGYSTLPFVVTPPTPFEGLNSASFGSEVTVVTGLGNRNILTGDLDVDGKPDFITLDQNDGTISLHRNISTAGTISPSSFEGRVTFATGSNPVWTAMADLDGDGKLDPSPLALSASSVGVFRNNTGMGVFTASSLNTRQDFGTGFNPEGNNIADIDGDGKPELLVPSSSNNDVGVFQNRSVGGVLNGNSFANRINFITGTSPRYVVPADIDGDGKIDLVLPNFNSSTISILRNSSTVGIINSSSFATKVDFGVGASPWYLATGDIDGDGKPDIVVANQGSNTLSIFRNTSTPGVISLASAVIFNTLSGPRGLAIDDLDGDGKPEIVISYQNTANISVFPNQASSGIINSSSLGGRIDYPISVTGVSVVVVDVDGDGRKDITASGNNTISILQNQMTTSASQVSILGTAIGAETSLVQEGSLGTAQKWGVVAQLSAGTFEFEVNNDPGLTYGDNEPDGILDLGGTAINVSTAGLYYISYSAADFSYSITQITTVGFLGSARTGDATGSDDPDDDMTDLGNGVYELTNYTLFDGDWKIRANDDFGIANWGDDGTDGSLDIFGADIPALAGIYNITVDILNNTYSVDPASTLADPGITVYALSDTEIQIEWNDIADEMGYRIFRSTDNANFTEITDLGADITGYTDTGLTPNTVYYYYVQAYDASTFVNSFTWIDATFSSDASTRFEEFGTFGGAGNDFGRSVAVDFEGNFYLAGAFDDNMTVDGVTLTADAGSRAAFLIKYNPAGNIIWANVFNGWEAGNGGGYAFANMVDVSNNGDIYLTGRYAGDLNGFITNAVFDTSSNFQYYVTNAFLMQIDPADGSVLWTRTLASDGYSAFYDITFDDADDIYIAGEWTGSVSFAGAGLTGGGPGLFKYNNSGQEIWSRVGLQSAFDFVGFALGVVSDGISIYLTGSTYSDTDFGGTLIMDQGGGEIFLIKYDQLGNVQWVQEASGDGSDLGFDVVLDDLGDPYITGYYRSTVLSSDTVTLNNSNSGVSEIYLIKCDQLTGDPIWGYSYGSSNFDNGIAMATDGSNIYLTGQKNKADADFNGVTVQNGTIYVASVDNSGTTNWVDVLEGDGIGRAMAYDNGYLYVPGYYRYPLNVGGAVFGSTNNTLDIFLGRMPVQVPFSNGLLGYYGFDDFNGTDGSGNGYDGLFTFGGNGSPFHDMDQYGNELSSMFFDGDGGYVEIDHVGDWDFTGELTWSGWVNISTFPNGAFNDIWSTILDSDGEIGQLNISANGSLDYHWFDGSTFSTFGTDGGTDPFTLTRAKWHMVTLTIDGGNIASLYVDGVLRRSGLIGRSLNGTSVMRISTPNPNPGDRRSFYGNIDDVRFYDIALSEQDIADIYALEVSDGKIAEYTFNAGLINENSEGYDLVEKNENGAEIPGTFTYSADRFGTPNGAVNFLKDNSGLNVGTMGNWDLWNAHSVNFWINPTSLGAGVDSWDVLWDDGNTGRLMLDNLGSLIYHWCDEVNCPVESSPTGVVTTGTWQMVTYTLDNSNNLNLYVNGQLVHSANGISRSYGGADVRFGSEFGFTDRNYDGLMDDISIWEKELTPAEIFALYGTEDDRVAYYPFNGNALDESGNGWDAATLNGPALTIDRFGNATSAYNFDGINQYMQAGKSISIQEDFTWTGWFLTSGNGTVMSITSNDGNWPFGGRNLYIGNGNVVFDASNIGEVRTGNTYNDGIWHHVAVTADMDPSGNDVVSIYMDGEFQASRGDWEIDQDSDAGLIFRMGYTSDPFPAPTYFTGDLDDISVYQVALTADDIRELFRAEGGTVKEQLAYFPFDGDAVDATGNGFNGDLCCLNNNFVNDRFNTGGGAFEFDLSGNIELAKSFELDGELTVSAWINIPDDATNHFIMSEAQNNQLWNFLVLSNGETYIEYWDIDGTFRDFTSNSNLVPFNTWTHVAVTYSDVDDEIRMFIDGTQVATHTGLGPGLRSDPTVIPTIGGYFDGSVEGTSSGVYDDIRVFSYALTDQEVLDLFDSESPSVTPLDPTDLKARVVGPDVVDLYWTDNANNETSYVVDWYTDGGVTFIDGLSVAANSQFARVTGLSVDTEYEFRVFAQNDFSSGPAIAVATTVDLGTPAVTVSPQFFTLDETITITVDPTKLYPPGELNTANDIFIHTGLVAQGAENLGGWAAAPGLIFTGADAGLMTNNGDGTFSITISDPGTFYGEDGTFEPSQIGMLFRSQDGSEVGAGPWNVTNSTGDIFIDIFNPSLVSPPDNLFLDIESAGELSLLDANAADPGVYNLNGPFTIEMWVNVPSTQFALTDQVLFSRTDDVDDADDWGFTSFDNVWNFEIFDNVSSSFALVPSSGTAVADSWVHLTGVWDGSEMRLYVNGEFQGSSSFTGSLNSPVSDPALQLARGEMAVKVNDLRIWNFARSEQEIRSYISMSLGGQESGLVGYWPMNDDPADGFTDDLVFGNHLEVIGDVGTGIAPDISVTASVNATTVALGGTLTVNYELTNVGTADIDVATTTAVGLTGGNLTDAILLNSQLDDVFLAANGGNTTNSIDVTIPLTVEPDDYTLLVVADNNEVIENQVDVSNDFFGISITVVQDNIDPTISINAPSTAPRGTFSVPITADDNSGSVTVEYFVRAAGSTSSPRTAQATSQGGTSFEAVIESTDFNNLGVTIWAVATDAAGNDSDADPVTIGREFTSDDPPPRMTIKNGSYQIFAWPYQPQSLASALIDLGQKTDETWRILTYSNSNDNYFDNISQLRPGIGYWLIADVGTSSLTFEGVSLVNMNNTFSFSLSQGWNMIGNPYLVSINWNEVISYNEAQGNIAPGSLSVLVTYNTGYSTGTSLNVHQGAFVNATTGLSNVEIPTSALNARIENEIAQPDLRLYDQGGWEMVMDIQASNGWRYGVAGFGELENALDGLDTYDMPGLPLFNRFLTATFLDEGLQNVTKSIKKTKDNHTWTFEVQSHERNPTAMGITFNGSPQMDAGQKMVLLDLQTGNVLDLFNEQTYSFTYSPGYTFKVIKGTEEFIAEQSAIERVLVNTIYPNPNDGQFRLPLYLPGEDQVDVRLTVKDISGKELGVLPLKNLPAGKHVLDIDLSNAVKSSGMYLLNITIHGPGKTSISEYRKVYIKK